ncbi:MAG: histidine kinase [Planctomycetaceae bacterium]
MNDVNANRVSRISPGFVRRLATALLAATVVLLGTAWLLYRQDLGLQRIITERERDAVLAIEREFLSREFQSVRSDLLYLAQQEVLQRFVAGDETARATVEREHLHFALRKGIYDQIRCLDPNGREITRVNFEGDAARIVPVAELQSKSDRYYYREALSLKDGEIFVSPFDLNVEHGRIEDPVKPVIRFVTPVFDASGRQRGLLVLNYLGERLLEHLREISAGFEGEVVLLNSDGEYLQARRREHEWGWLLGHDHSFRTDFPDEWQRVRQPIPGHWQSGDALLAAARIRPNGQGTAAAPRDIAGEDNSLLLVAYVSRNVATAHSELLLRQLLLMCAGAMLLVFPLSWIWARSAELRDRQKRLIADSESRLRQLSTRLLAAQETERKHLSRDLHDELGQQVTAISLDLKSAARQQLSPQVQSRLQRAIEETDSLLKSLHRIASRVRPSVLDDLGLRAAVESHLSEFQDRTGVTVDADLQFHREEVPAVVGENTYRVLQEALANIAEHARTHHAAVKLTVSEDSLQLTVSDDGAGFDADQARKSRRLGLLGMQERAELLGGRFLLKTSPDNGTTIDVTIPLENFER